MTESSRRPRAAVRALVALTLITPFLLAAPAVAQDIFDRRAEETVMLRDGRKVGTVTATVEVRFLTVSDDFLERVGVDFSGAVFGQAVNKGQGVENAKLILEVFKVKKDATNQEVVRVGRKKVATDSDGAFRVRMRELIDSDTRKAIEAGEIAALRVEANGKNAKKVDFVRLVATAALGGLIQ